jgi:hypothetical protein
MSPIIFCGTTSLPEIEYSIFFIFLSMKYYVNHCIFSHQNI